MGEKRNTWFIWLLLLSIASQGVFAVLTEAVTCAICGMDTKPRSKISFEATHEGKHIHFCSISCVLRFHAKHKDVPIFGYNFDDGEKIDTKGAFFLVKSSKILKELEFGMPPSVVVFSSKQSAKRTQARLGDGTVVKGLEETRKIFQ